MQNLKIIFSIIPFIVASVGAFYVNAAPYNSDELLETGWVLAGPTRDCVNPTDVDCTTIAGNPLCMSSEAIPRQEYKKNVASDCTIYLYRNQ
jgi:hypothetical protein